MALIAQMYHDIPALYNTLPELGEADELFSDRDAVFEKLSTLLAAFDFKWGICLVHIHSKLKQNEIMLSDGLISQPTVTSSNAAIYPERWLNDGRPYEFTTQVTEAPPSRLIHDFYKLTKDMPFLGLFYSNDFKIDEDLLLMEHTEGRQNICERVVSFDKSLETIETAWLPGGKYPVRMRCVISCETRNTRTGSVHKGKVHNK